MDPTTCTVTSRHAPTIRWRCPRCDGAEVFACAERFRGNSNGKRLDIWLIYRCRRCDATKNITVVERAPVAKVPAALRRAAEVNDGAEARRLTRDVGLLRRAGAEVADGDAWDVSPAGARLDGDAPARLRLVFPEPLLVRLDAVLAVATGASRRSVRDLVTLPAGAPRIDALRLWCTVEVDVAPWLSERDASPAPGRR